MTNDTYDDSKDDPNVTETNSEPDATQPNEGTSNGNHDNVAKGADIEKVRKNLFD